MNINLKNTIFTYDQTKFKLNFDNTPYLEIEVPPTFSATTSFLSSRRTYATICYKLSAKIQAGNSTYHCKSWRKLKIQESTTHVSTHAAFSLRHIWTTYQWLSNFTMHPIDGRLGSITSDLVALLLRSYRCVLLYAHFTPHVRIVFGSKKLTVENIWEILKWRNHRIIWNELQSPWYFEQSRSCENGWVKMVA